MSFLDRIRPGERRFEVHAIHETATFTGSQGDTLYANGYVPVRADGARFAADDHATSDPHVFHCMVAGTHHYRRMLGDRRFDVGERLQLRPESGNPQDPNAIGIWDAGGTVQIGYVPVTLSRMLGRMARDGGLTGQIARELRVGSASGERTMLYVLVRPPGRVNWVVRD